MTGDTDIFGLTGTARPINRREYDPYSMRNNDLMTCQNDGWYQISYYLHHPTNNISLGDYQSGLGWFSIGLKFNLTNRFEYTYQDGNGGVPDTCNYIATLYLTKDDTFYFVYETSSETFEDFIVRISIMKLI